MPSAHAVLLFNGQTLYLTMVIRWTSSLVRTVSIHVTHEEERRWQCLDKLVQIKGLTTVLGGWYTLHIISISGWFICMATAWMLSGAGIFVTDIDLFTASRIPSCLHCSVVVSGLLKVVHWVRETVEYFTNVSLVELLFSVCKCAAVEAADLEDDWSNTYSFRLGYRCEGRWW